eukprot:TRINITY_DN2196_c0_g1_i7.p1 TRINITY_DN2196_c0_g1~~TRINITY_DN2196_c0_g1_i7.p1  ORF type:complete len:138 (-),score=1.44 TRINITY_DN2196_c0_g1_i7:384-797(-)
MKWRIDAQAPRVPQTLYFMHIPKTGGSATSMLLSRFMFGPHRHDNNHTSSCYSYRPDGSLCSQDDWPPVQLNRTWPHPHVQALPYDTAESRTCRRVTAIMSTLQSGIGYMYMPQRFSLLDSLLRASLLAPAWCCRLL